MDHSAKESKYRCNNDDCTEPFCTTTAKYCEQLEEFLSRNAPGLPASAYTIVVQKLDEMHTNNIKKAFDVLRSLAPDRGTFTN